jgi:hypothetical protein
MQTFLIILGIHVFEIICILGFLLIRKNKKLEQAYTDQQNYIEMLSNIISISNKRLEEIDNKGMFSSDDEIGWFFEQLKEIQTSLNEFNLKK